MRTSFALQADRSKDAAIRGPVRAYAAQLGSFFWHLVATTAFINLLTGFATAAPQMGKLDFGVVARAVESYFASQPDYQPGDLITRAQIEKVLGKLADAGVKVPEADAIAKLGLASDSLMVRELSTPAGRKFMRKLARNPSAYSHLDRLSSIPRGEKLVHDLIGDKGGDKLVEYLATTKGGQKMGSMMAGVRGGGDLNKPAGRIYTVADLLAAMKAAFEKASP